MSTTTKRRSSAAEPSPYAIERAFTALTQARENLLAIEPDMPDDDAELYRDCLEGESGDARRPGFLASPVPIG